MSKIFNGLIFIFFFVFLLSLQSAAKIKVLIIQDEFPAIEILSDFLEKNDIKIDIIEPNHFNHKLSNYDAVIMYIHAPRLEKNLENQIINYTNNGGRLICIHHTINSQKAINNKQFMEFLGVQLDDVTNSREPRFPGEGYAWRQPVKLTLINLNSKHYITNHNIRWEDSIYYQPSDIPSIGKEYPSFTLRESEVYLNHKFTDGREKVILLGLKFFDDRNNQLFMQDRAAWYKNTENGDIFYFMPGHSLLDFENPNYSQMILNAINFSK